MGSKNLEERFTLQLKYDSDKGLKNYNTKFVAHNRISKYGGYKVCSDTNDKDLNVCICNLGKSGKGLKLPPKLTKMLNLYPVRTDHVYRVQNKNFCLSETIKRIDGKHIGLLKRIVYEQKNKNTGLLDNHRSTTFELVNYSSDKTYEVTIIFTKFKNMKPMDGQE